MGESGNKWKVEHVIDKGAGREWLTFYCPGCKFCHNFWLKGFRITWKWNGSKDKPTITPSLIIKWPSPKGERVCHVIVTDGNLRYCHDCTHELKGKTIKMIDIDNG